MNEKAHIVILEEDHLLKDSLINKINNKGNYEVIAAFENGIQCLKYLSEHEVDIFIIDLMLTNIDGVGIINQLRKDNPKGFKKLICISDFNSVVFEMIDELSIDYCLRKPFNLDYFIEILNRITKDNFADDKEHRNVIIKSEITRIFDDIGVPRHLKGYNYLVPGISSVCNNINLLGEITKELYPSIARNHATTASRVEQAIRHVIKVTWSNGNQEELQNIFGFRAKEKLCNSEFISKIADLIISKYNY